MALKKAPKSDFSCLNFQYRQIDDSGAKSLIPFPVEIAIYLDMKTGYAFLNFELFYPQFERWLGADSYAEDGPGAAEIVQKLIKAENLET